MQIPPSSRYVTPRPGFCHLNKSEILALYLAESVHPNALDAGIQTGMYFTDTKSQRLATFFRRDVVPRLESAGMKVVFCDLTSAIGFEAAVFVQDAIADLTAPANRQTRGDRRVSENRRKSNSIDDAVRTRAAGMIVTAVDRLKSDLVFILDGVERLLDDAGGRSLLAGLQDARMLVNSREGTPGHFLLVCIGRDDVTLDRLARGCAPPRRRLPDG